MFLKPLRLLVKALTAQDSPRQMAAGFALGALIGLIPKSSLLAQLTFMTMCIVNVNLAAGIGAAALFTLIAPLADPLTHRIGYLFLVQFGFLKPLWTFLYNLPIIPWTRFNHTITLGSFVLGITLFYPLYHLMTPIFARYQAQYGDRLRRLRIVQFLLGAEIAEKLQ